MLFCFCRMNLITYDRFVILVLMFSWCASVSSDPHHCAMFAIKWLPEIRKYYPKVPVVLVGTQTDLRTDLDVLVDLARFRWVFKTKCRKIRLCFVNFCVFFIIKMVCFFSTLHDYPLFEIPEAGKIVEKLLSGNKKRYFIETFFLLLGAEMLSISL